MRPFLGAHTQTGCSCCDSSVRGGWWVQVIHQDADPVQVMIENMSRPLKYEVNPLVAEAAQAGEAARHNAA